MIATHIGFTGTREGMTPKQLEELRVRLTQMKESGAKVFHHGDCVGADAQAHAIARELGYWIVGHPPEISKFRAFCACDELRPEKPYHQRNQDIVNESYHMFAAPRESTRQHRGGTWSTVGKAERAGMTARRSSTRE